MTPERLKAERERAKEVLDKLQQLQEEAASVAEAARKAYYESIAEFRVGDYVYDREGRMFQLTDTPSPGNSWFLGAMVKKDGTLSKKTALHVWPPLTKSEKP